jgi:hypothetical protein
MTRKYPALVLGAFAALGFQACNGTTGSQTGVPIAGEGENALKRVFVVIFENTNAADALKQPFMKELATQGAYLDQMYALGRPSQANYIGLTSGSTQGVATNSNVDLNVSNLADLLEAKGKTWRAYNEGYPGNCYTGATWGTYARKHEPFMSYTNIRTNPARCANIVDSDTLDQDIASGNLPDFSFYVPDSNNSGHDTGVAYADAALRERFEPLINDPNFMDGTLFIVTFDESGADATNHIYTSFYGASVIPGKVSTTKYTLYSLLRTIEETFALGTLGRNDATAAPITGIWAN